MKQLNLFTKPASDSTSQSQSVEKLTSSLAGFRNYANHFQLQENKERKKMTVTSGQRCLELLRNVNQAGLLAKMLLESSSWHSNKCVLIWKAKGMKSGRLLFQLAPSTLHTDEIEFGLLPTPTVTQINNRQKVMDLKSKGLSFRSRQLGSSTRNYSIMDWIVFHGLLPTPTASDHKGGRKAIRKGSTVKNNLRDFVTITTGSTYPNPEFLEAMMGFPKGWTEINH